MIELATFEGPFTLKEFLRRYFFIQVVFGHDDAPPDNSILLPPGAAVFVYVSLDAPPPPVVKVGGMSSVSHLLTPNQTVHPSHPAKQHPETWGPTSFRDVKITRAVLASAFWQSFFSQAPFAVIQYLTDHCPTVQQFEAGGGALHLLGPRVCDVGEITRRTRKIRCGRQPIRPLKVQRGDPQQNSALSTNLQREPLLDCAITPNRMRTVSLSSSVSTLNFEQLLEVFRSNRFTTDELKSSCFVKELTQSIFLGSLRGADSEQCTHHKTTLFIALCSATAQFCRGISKLNTRRAEIVHFGQIEKKVCARPGTVEIESCCVEVHHVVAYLEFLLSQLKFLSSCGSRSDSFWGTSANLKSVLRACESWMLLGRRGMFPASTLLRGFKVAHLPWLRSAVGGKHRSAILQRAFTEFGIFLFSQVLPFLIVRHIHVTVSARFRNHFVFIPRAAWSVLRANELNFLLQNNDAIAFRLVTPDEVLRKAVQSPLRMVVLFSSLKFLPCGNKLRPISVVRAGSGKALMGMASGRPHHRDGMRAVIGPKPNASILRRALLCLFAGVCARRRHCCAAQVSNTRHSDEYPLFLSFFKECQQYSTAFGLSAKPLFLRGDGQRCYDRIPQSAVVSAVNTLVSEEEYYRCRFRAVTVKAGTEIQERRTWFSTITKSDVINAEIHGIPKSWIVEEDAVCDVINGEETRQLLSMHLTDHLVSIRKEHEFAKPKLFCQTVGICQGSAVAMVICDTILEEVDKAMITILEEYVEPALVLRRLDDVLIGALSPVAIAQCRARMLEGWPSVGYLCNLSKLQCSAAGSECPRLKWCGLVLDTATLEWSVDWARLQGVDLYSLLSMKPLSEWDITEGLLRLLQMVQMRTPLTLFCATLNSPRRIVQTVLEICTLFAQTVVSKIVHNWDAVRPHPRLVLKPLRFVLFSLWNHIQRAEKELTRHGSWVGIDREQLQFLICDSLADALSVGIKQTPPLLKKLRRFLYFMLCIVKHRTQEPPLFSFVVDTKFKQNVKAALSQQ